MLAPLGSVSGLPQLLFSLSKYWCNDRRVGGVHQDIRAAVLEQPAACVTVIAIECLLCNAWPFAETKAEEGRKAG